MALTAKYIKELFLEYSSKDWPINPVYVEGLGMIPDLEQWFIEKWRLILTNKKSSGAEIVAEMIEKVLKIHQTDMKRTFNLSEINNPYAFDLIYYAKKDKTDKTAQDGIFKTP